MARRARVVEVEHHADPYRFRGVYTPYHDSACLHERRIEETTDGWLVQDHVQGADGALLEGFLHIHPDARVVTQEDRFVVQSRSARLVVEPFGWSEVKMVHGHRDPTQGWYFSSFGVAREAPVLVCRQSNRGSHLGFRLRLS